MTPLNLRVRRLVSHAVYRRVGLLKVAKHGMKNERPVLAPVAHMFVGATYFPRLVSRPAFFRSTLPCSAAPVSIRRPRSRVPRLGTRLGGLRLAVLRCVRPHCRAGVVPVHRPTARKMIQVVLAMTWSTQTK